MCESLTSVTIPNQVTTIGRATFFGCINLPSITLPSSLTAIGTRAFMRCTALTSITIPDKVVTIGSSAFADCSAITSIHIPNSVTTIGVWAFAGDSALISITIPSKVTNIKSLAFADCTSLKTVNFNAINCVEMGRPPAGGGNGPVFTGCSELTTLNIGNGVTTLPWCAFSYCSNLTSVTIPSSVISIEPDAFGYCSRLTSITNLNPKPVNIVFEYGDVFTELDKATCSLIVPTSAVLAYKNAAVWKEFNIVAGGILVYPKADNPEHGYVTGNNLYGGRSIATVTAIPYSGYRFVNWTKNGTEVSKANPYSFTVTEDVELVANFEEGVGIVETRHATSLQVYPNPVKNEIIIESEEINLSNEIVKIFDLLGQEVFERKLSGNKVDVSQLPAGVYLLKVGGYFSKFVKE